MTLSVIQENMAKMVAKPGRPGNPGKDDVPGKPGYMMVDLEKMLI